jgi:hypothetical protein
MNALGNIMNLLSPASPICPAIVLLAVVEGLRECPPPRFWKVQGFNA